MKLLQNTLTWIDRNKKSHFWIFFLVLVLLTIFMQYCFSPTYFGQDLAFHLRRLRALTAALQDGTFPCYIDYVSINHYGYLSNVFYSDVLLIPFAFIGMYTDTMTAYTCILLVSTIACGVFTYQFIYKVYRSSFAASTGAILYTFSFYRMFDLFYRASLGETMSFVFIPLVFLGLYYIAQDDYRKWYVVTVAFSLMIFNHLLSTFMLVLVVVLYLLYYFKNFMREPKRLWYLLLAAMATVFITAYFTFPFIEQSYSNIFYFKTHAWTNISQSTFSWSKMLVEMSAVYEDTTYLNERTSFYPKIGFVLILGIFLGVFLKEKRSKQAMGVFYFVLLGLICIALSINIFPWNRFPFNKLSFIQFPWRFYEFATFFFAVASGFFISQLVKLPQHRLYIQIAMIVLVCMSIKSEGDNYSINLSGNKLDSLPSLTMSNHYLGGGLEYLPGRLSSIQMLEKRGEVVLGKKVFTEAANIVRDKGITSFDVQVHEADSVELPLIYYKGYEAYMGDELLEVDQSKNGLVQLPVDESGRVVVYYAGTPLQHISFYVSVVSVIGLLVYIYYARRRKKLVITQEPTKDLEKL